MSNLNIRQHTTELVEEGYTIIPGIYSPEDCQRYIRRFEDIILRFTDTGRQLDTQCQIITNPFRHDTVLTDLIYHEVFDSILKVLIDEDYVLINSNIINRRLNSTVVPGGKNIGTNWHTDSRYLGGQRLDRGFSYIVGTMFNDFSSENGSTQFVPRSHLRRERPERYADYPYEHFQGTAGSMVIFDTGLWHRGGTPAEKDRWSMYNYYGPWFVKPYFRYPEMLGKEFGDKASKTLRRLFHYNSTPPLTEDENDGLTLTRD